MHDLIAGDDHLSDATRGNWDQFCNCFGPCCFNSDTQTCRCDECNCPLEEKEGYEPEEEELTAEATPTAA